MFKRALIQILFAISTVGAVAVYTACAGGPSPESIPLTGDENQPGTSDAPIGVSPVPAPSTTSPAPSVGSDCDGVLGDPVREEVCVLSNEERAGAGVVALKLDPALSRVAQAHAEDMAAQGYFSHTSPDGGTMVSRLKAAGIPYGYAGENIAKGQRTPETVMAAWMSSSGHRANILRSQYRKIGVGHAQNIWVQEFTN